MTSLNVVNRRSPAFAEPLHVGQHNLPAWDRYAEAMRGIFERRYYTNQGPLTREFEERLQAFLGVKHAVCVTNPTIGLMMASEALGITGRVLVPGVCNAAVGHALAWCGVDAMYCDVDPATGLISVERALENADDSISAVLGANMWGGACNSDALTDLARTRGLPVLFDSAHAFGCEVAGKRLGTFGQLEVFSFDESEILNAAGGACVATCDDELAARLRNIRSSYGAGRPVKVVKTSNGRMSEAQAAMGLLSLDDYAANRAHNRLLFETYRARLNRIPGIRVIEPAGVDVSNHQALVCEVDEQAYGMSRDTLIERLATDNVEARRISGAHDAASPPLSLPGTAHLRASWLMLPIGADVHATMLETLCEIVALAPLQAASIAGAAA